MTRSGRTRALSRRRFLTGLGGVSVALPWLERLNGGARAQSAVSGPRRVIVVAYSMGVPLGQWRPSAVGSTFELPYVTQPLDPFKDRCLFVSSLDHSMLAAGGDPFVWGHPGKHEAALTGTLTTGAFPTTNDDHIDQIRSDATTDGGANGPSVEHVIGQALRSTHPFGSVDLAVDGDAGLATWGPPPATATSRFFFQGRGNAVSLSSHPNQAFASLFAGIGGEEPSEADVALRQLRERNKSVLDAVRDSFVELQQGLGSEDRRRLEEHAALIRQLEVDIQVSAQCTVPEGLDGATDYSGFDMSELAPLQRRLLAHAMACDLAPVGRLEFVNQQNPRFGIPDLDDALDQAGAMYDWHAMVHGDPLPGTTSFLRPGRGEDVPYDARLLDGYRFFVAEFAALLAELDAIPEGPETSVLDHSLVILASDLGEGLGHGHMKMGYVLAGNLGSARRGYHYDAGPAQAFEVGGGYYYADSVNNVNQLLNSILDMAAVTDAQGAPANIGLGGYLESVGKTRRIDGLFT